MKIAVTERAVIKRLKRPLLNKGQYLHIANSRKQKRWGLGRYYLLDKKGVVDKDVNIEQLARQLGVVMPRRAALSELPTSQKNGPNRGEWRGQFLKRLD